MKLRILTAADLDMILVWRNAPLVRENMYTTHVISACEHAAWFERVREDETKRYFVFENNGIACGVVGFVDVDSRSRRSSWAFYASTSAPRGTGSKMEYLAMEYAFNEMNLHKLHCEVLGFNQAVVKLHLSFGFNLEGTLRKHHYDGVNYHDIIQLGIMDDEWRQQRLIVRRKLRLDEVSI